MSDIITKPTDQQTVIEVPVNDDQATQSPFNDDQQTAITKMIAEAAKQARIEQQKEDQSRFDREVTNRKKIELELAEVKKNSMTEIERANYEREQAEAQLNLRIAEAEAKELNFSKGEELQRLSMPIELRSLVQGADMVQFRENVEALLSVFDVWYKSKLNQHIQQNAVQPNTTTNNNGAAQQPSIKGNPFVKGSADYNLTAQMKLYQENRSEYDRLKNEAAAIKG